MFRLLLALVIITILITYLFIPLVKYFKKFGKAEIKRFNKSLDIDDNKKIEEKTEETIK